MNTKELKKAMIDREINQSDLAETLGVSRASISSKMNNKSTFTLSQAQKIITFMKLSKTEAYDIFFAK